MPPVIGEAHSRRLIFKHTYIYIHRHTHIYIMPCALCYSLLLSHTKRLVLPFGVHQRLNHGINQIIYPTHCRMAVHERVYDAPERSSTVYIKRVEREIRQYIPVVEREFRRTSRRFAYDEYSCRLLRGYCRTASVRATTSQSPKRESEVF